MHTGVLFSVTVNHFKGVNMLASELLEKKYLNEKEVAAITGRAVSTLRNERFMRKGIPYYKVSNRTIRYKTEDVISFMEGHRITFDEVNA
jgi:hypothetical protein